MLQHLFTSWKSNQGNLLIILGSITGLLMCLVWYFKLVPEVRLLTSETQISNISKPQPQEHSPLVITLRLPELPQLTATEGDEPYSQGFVELLMPEGHLVSERTPQSQRVFKLDTLGPIAVLFGDVLPGEYTILVFLDLNGNNKLDFLGSHPMEPFRLSSSPTAASDNLDLEQAVVTIQPGEVTLVEFDFSNRH